MKIFKVGFKSEYTYSINMIWANTGKEEREAVEETAASRAERYGYEVAFVEEITEREAQSNINKGMPYYGIDEQAERDHDPSFAEEVTEDEAEQEPTAAEIVERIAAEVEQTKTRSAWSKGVKAYAVELVENLAEAVRGGWVDETDISNRRLLEKAILNGADSWSQYSEGGCALIYNADIAERLCTASELRKTDNGRKDPNPRENWIDVQSRALFQAAQLVINAAF